MNNYLLLFYILLTTINKVLVKIPYIYSILGLTLYYQLIFVTLIVSLFYTKFNYLVYIVCKVYKPLKIVFFKINFNKALLFNKIAIVHIFYYTLGLILWILVFVLPSKLIFFFSSLHILFIIILGIVWSSQEVLWEGFWNWNLIEISILIFNLFLILTLHKKLLIREKTLIILVSVFIYLYFNHYPLKISIHNFTNNKYLKITNWFITPLLIILYYNKKTILYWIIFTMWYLQIIKLLSTQTLFYKSFFLTYFLILHINFSYLFFIWNIHLILIQTIFWIVVFLYNKIFIKHKFIFLLHLKLPFLFLILVLLQYVYTFNRYYINTVFIENYVLKKIIYSQSNTISSQRVLGFNSNFKLILRYRTVLYWNVNLFKFQII